MRCDGLLIGGLFIGLLGTARAWDPHCLSNNKPTGFGSLATGGAGGLTVKPQNKTDLAYLLSLEGNLIIDVDQEYDFTDLYGFDTYHVCFYGDCVTIAQPGTCSGRKIESVRLPKTATSGMPVSSNKTIMSSNGRGAIKGTGLVLKDAENIIIRDIRISDINAGTPWGGTAISFSNAAHVWIHNVTFSRIGQQHMYSMLSSIRGLTVSSCFMDGTKPWAANCDAAHRDIMSFNGDHNHITVVNNRFFNTSGLSLAVSAVSAPLAKNFVHVIANEFDTNRGYVIELGRGSTMLVEGNKFININDTYDHVHSKGQLAMIDFDADVKMCKKLTGEKCPLNAYIKTLPMAERVDQGALLESHRNWKTVSSAREDAKTCLGGMKLPTYATDDVGALSQLFDSLEGFNLLSHAYGTVHSGLLPKKQHPNV